MIMQQNIAPYILTERQKQLLMKNDIDNVFESIYYTIISNIQNHLEKVWAGVLI